MAVFSAVSEGALYEDLWMRNGLSFPPYICNQPQYLIIAVRQGQNYRAVGHGLS